MNRPDTLTATIRIAAAPAEVFPYLVEPHLLIQWIGAWADLNPEPGGVFALEVGDVPVRGAFVSVEPPNRVVFTWGIPGSDTLPAGSSTVEILLKADGDETVVELFHHDLPADQLPQHEAGWTSFLDKLRQAASS
ncbi:MAG TPA: SRPBCC domain-containing protein [Chloroflexota bacterium]|nr:SRPBCC domain-containing protein [Chloroflexota bacterium]